MKKIKILFGGLLFLLALVGCGDFIFGNIETEDDGDVFYYTITFNSQGGSSVSSITSAYNSDITLPLAVRSGYTFDGWYSSSSGGAFYGNNGDIHTVTGNVTMYARWTENTVEPTYYTIYFNSQGGTDFESITELYGTEISLPTPTRDGYTFNGWYNSDGYVYYGDGGSNYTITQNVTMYAQWTEISGGGNFPCDIYPNMPGCSGINSGGGEDGDVMTINGIECVLVKAGTFTMGSPTSEEGRWDDETQHQVTLTQDFWISRYEITNAQYGKSVSGKENHPVESVTWYNADDFAKSKGGRLPTEAEWEFAARGGNKSNGYIYSGSDNLDGVGWYDDNPGYGNHHPVGQKQPNELGIYDMSGNVWEWCNDWYGSYPIGSITGGFRVVRGGGLYGNAYNCRVAYRGSINPSNSYNFLGFRVVFPRE